MKVYKLNPVTKDAIWGGNRLFALGKTIDGNRIAESWELSFVPGSEATVDGGKPLSEAFKKEEWGEACRDFERFPVLTKLIDAREKLSVQVHPSDEYALAHEGSYGKTEMWYVVDCDKGAGIYVGFRERFTKERIAAAIADGSLEELLSFVPCRPGDVFFIPAGTVHAIGAGTLIFEIQQNSTLTYRLYDYMRRDAEGNLRPLHVDKAMQVLDPGVYQPQILPADNPAIIGYSRCFVAEKHEINGDITLNVGRDSYLCVTCVAGSGYVGGEEARTGDSFFAPAGDAKLTLSGKMTVISVKTPTPCE